MEIWCWEVSTTCIVAAYPSQMIQEASDLTEDEDMRVYPTEGVPSCLLGGNNGIKTELLQEAVGCSWVATTADL